MRRSEIAPFILALVWLAIVAVDYTGYSLRWLGQWFAVVVALFAVLTFLGAWRAPEYFQFSMLTRVLFLPTFAWACVVIYAAATKFTDSLIPLGGHELMLTATLILTRSLLAAALLTLIVGAPLVLVFQRHAPVVAALVCVPIIAMMLWLGGPVRPLTMWLTGAALVLLVVLLVGFAWLAARRGMFSGLALNPDAAQAPTARRPSGSG